MLRIPVYIGDRVRIVLPSFNPREEDGYSGEGIVVGFESDTHTLVLFGSDSEPESVWTHRLIVTGRGPNAPAGSPLSPEWTRRF